jgi:uncharacterized protein YggE
VRLVILVAALALLAPAAAGAQPAAPPALAPGEVLLEIDATGAAHSRPDLVRLYVAATSRGETAAKARELNSALMARIASAARANGVAEADVHRMAAPGSRLGLLGNEAVGWTVATPDAPPTGKSESALLEIRVRDASRLEALRTAVEDAGAAQVVGPLSSLQDDSAARRAAKEDAVRKARAEAEDYARSLGMRVSRLLRVSERTGPAYADPAEAEAMMAAMFGFPTSPADDIETRLRIAVDFALAPTP